MNKLKHPLVLVLAGLVAGYALQAKLAKVPVFNKIPQVKA
jgi:hypothetical protein